jgi:hypothetical protein
LLLAGGCCVVLMLHQHLYGFLRPQKIGCIGNLWQWWKIRWNRSNWWADLWSLYPLHRLHKQTECNEWQFKIRKF